MTLFNLDETLVNLINGSAQAYDCDSDVFIEALFTYVNKKLEEDEGEVVLFNGFIRLAELNKRDMEEK